MPPINLSPLKKQLKKPEWVVPRGPGIRLSIAPSTTKKNEVVEQNSLDAYELLTPYSSFMKPKNYTKV